MDLHSSYITKDAALEAVSNVLSFSEEVDDLYDRHGISVHNDVGRKNILLSAAQEKFFAKALQDRGYECRVDGKTGEPDILVKIRDMWRELECKVTCISKKGTWQLQTDERTLEQKGGCDFLYLLFNRDHDEVAVLFFENLEPSDFHKAASSSRGKARMKKHSAFKKCTPLIGGFTDKKNVFLDSYREKYKAAKTNTMKSKYLKKIELWENKDSQFSIQLESVDGIKQ